MALDPNEIVAAAPVAPAVEEIVPVTPVVEEVADADDSTELPDEVLKIPLIGGLLEGKPAAIYDLANSKIPPIEAITRNAKLLTETGINFYKSKDGALSVMFNSQFISQKELEKADKDGKLTEIAEPLASVMAAYDSVLSESAAPAGSAPSASPAPQSPNTPINKRLTTARLQNLEPGSPTSGPAPGGGRIINEVLRRAV